MAGYVFAIGGDQDPLASIKKCAEQGVYSTYLSGISPLPFEGTLADYMSMKPGDNIYFFCKRKYYGVGELVNVGLDCKYCNFPDSTARIKIEYEDIKDSLMVDFGQESAHYRWLCTFKGSPYFFEEGIDTDEILTYKPTTFKMLRAFWKVSFIKLSDEENESLKEIFLLRHQKEMESMTGILPESTDIHKRILEKDLPNYLITPYAMLATCADGIKIKHEMALEAAVIYDICNHKCPLIGEWDYLSHQVVASPFKPIDYMDKIDVFAMRFLFSSRIPCKYLVAELKKDTAYKDTIDQVLKYVDWVCGEYAYGDYEMIEACIIAADYEDGIESYFEEIVKRYYTLGSHPVRNNKWSALKLIRYAYKNGQIEYEDVTPEITET